VAYGEGEAEVKIYLLIIVATAISLGASRVNAQQPKQIGNWLVNIEKDRFTEDTNVIAIAAEHGSILAVRCLQHKLTIAIRDPLLISGHSAGDLFAVSFKGGNHAVAKTMADAVDPSMIEIMVTNEIRQDLLTSNEYAFRFMSALNSFDMIFQAGDARRALQPVLNACPPTKDQEQTEGKE
jgi:hypothetical protein